MIMNMAGGKSEDFIAVEMQTTAANKTLVFTGIPFEPVDYFVIDRTLDNVWSINVEVRKRQGETVTYRTSNNETFSQLSVAIGSSAYTGTVVTYNAEAKTLTLTSTGNFAASKFMGLFFKK